MLSEFEVITDVAEISRLNKQLSHRLREVLPYKENREITSPAGHQPGIVHFEKPRGTGVRAWSSRERPNRLLNLFLSADPGTTKLIDIDVQLNFPAGTYKRLVAGAFVRDASGDIFVAHRGKLTRGNAGLPKDKVLREFAASCVDASDDGKTSRIILIAGLNEPALADRLWEFAGEARVVATRIGEELHGGKQSRGAGTARRGGQLPKAHAGRTLKLRGYFDEYSGEGRTKGHGGGQRTVEHGAVVRALEWAMRSNGISLKAQAIDLAIVATTKVDLFEVKTSAETTDVYTGIGQLVMHGACIEKLLRLPVDRHLVIPELPKESYGRTISGKAGINVLTFRKAGKFYKFAEL